MSQVLIPAAVVLAVMVVVVAVFLWVIRPWYLYWGASAAEVKMALPGDELIPASMGGHNRAITIEAPPSAIWPWLVQMGADKGGLYSHTWIEKLIKCPMENADHIHPEWQDLKPGDLLRMCQNDPAPPPYIVAQVLPERALVVGHRATEADGLGEVEWFDTWAFVLEPVGADITRLIARSRNAKNVAWMRIIEPGFFVMESEMLRGVKKRVERREQSVDIAGNG